MNNPNTEADGILGYEKVDFSDFAWCYGEDDNNGGLTYGVHFGTYEEDGTSIDVDARWFATENEQDAFSKELESEGHLEVSDIRDQFQA